MKKDPFIPMMYLKLRPEFFELPQNTYTMSLRRSGPATQGIWIHNGIIDCDYRGMISFIVANIGKMHIGQAILMLMIPRKYTLVQTLSKS